MILALSEGRPCIKYCREKLPHLRLNIGNSAELFRIGESVSASETWKARGEESSVCGAVLLHDLRASDTLPSKAEL
jgi:hypothetical protein